jgi:hypothetical protein
MAYDSQLESGLHPVGLLPSWRLWLSGLRLSRPCAPSDRAGPHAVDCSIPSTHPFVIVGRPRIV